MTKEQSIQEAARHHQAGQRVEAEALCRQILAEEPNHPEALHLMGILTAQGGQLDAAIEMISLAVQISPDLTEAWTNLGCILVHKGKVDEAIAAYTHVTRLSPTNAAAHYALGLLLRDQGRLDEAILALSSATRLKPDYAEAHFKLGLSLRSQRRLDEAIAAYSKAVALKPDLADAHNNLANALRDKRQFDEAIAEYVRAIQLKPNDAVAHFNLANAFTQNERFPEAVVTFERAIELKGDYFEAHNQLALSLGYMQRFDEAMQSHHRALALRPDDATAHETLATTLLQKHDMDGAALSFRRALALGSCSARTWNGLGMALQALGQFDEASDSFRRALEISPDTPFFHKNLITSNRQEAGPAEIEHLTELLNQISLPISERVNAGFAVGKLLDDCNRFDEAFAIYSQTNSLFKEWRASDGKRYDGTQSARMVGQIIQNFTPGFFAARRHWGDPSEQPVFIVGMPRSGTSLVEQIAASHPSVFGAGELQDVDRMFANLPGGEDRTAGQRWDVSSIAKAAQGYLTHVRSLAAGAARITDKLPGNIWYLGLITMMFPNARVIFCRRDARDNCLSCYFQRFGHKNFHLYIYDLADCAGQYLDTQRLAAHWLKTLPLRMLEMNYEELVADQEGQSRRLIEFLGLPWDPACLEFHKNKRVVVTASVWQVRQPMYDRSVGRWRNYERHLGPLLEVLAAKRTKPGPFCNQPIFGI